jgi:hypothetical protein
MATSYVASANNPVLVTRHDGARRCLSSRRARGLTPQPSPSARRFYSPTASQVRVNGARVPSALVAPDPGPRDRGSVRPDGNLYVGSNDTAQVLRSHDRASSFAARGLKDPLSSRSRPRTSSTPPPPFPSGLSEWGYRQQSWPAWEWQLRRAAGRQKFNEPLRVSGRAVAGSGVVLRADASVPDSARPAPTAQ